MCNPWILVYLSQEMEKLKQELRDLQDSEKERQEIEVKAARDRQRAIDDLDRGVSMSAEIRALIIKHT